MQQTALFILRAFYPAGLPDDNPSRRTVLRPAGLASLSLSYHLTQNAASSIHFLTPVRSSRDEDR
jgi:hypothetical protein